MNLSTLSDKELYEAAIPIWELMKEGSNLIDYEIFSTAFSDELVERLKKEKFEEQCRKIPLLTSLGDSEPIAVIRREEGVTIIFRLFSSKLKGEFLAQIKLLGTIDNIEVSDAQVY